MNNMAAARKLRYTFPPCGPCSAARVTKKGATISGRQTCVLGSPPFTNLALENSSWRTRTGRYPSTLASLPEADCAAICERAEIHNRPMRECNSEALPALRSVTREPSVYFEERLSAKDVRRTPQPLEAAYL